MQWLSDALNTNAHTFEVAPVFLIVERALIDYTIHKLKWTNGGDGITAPGGSLANMYGLMLARHNLYPDIKTKARIIASLFLSGLRHRVFIRESLQISSAACVRTASKQAIHK